MSDEAGHALDTAEGDQGRWYEVGFVAESSSDESEEEDTVVQETGVVRIHSHCRKHCRQIDLSKWKNF